MRFDRCGANSVWDDQFEHGAWGFGKRGMLCPVCRVFVKSDEGAQALRYLLALAAFGIVVRAVTKGDFVLTGAGIVIAATVVLTVAHELAHAIAGRIVGVRIHGLQVGSGPVAYRFPLWGARVDVCRNLIGGGACCLSHPGEPARWRVAACIGAPLVMQAVLIPVSLVWGWPYIVVGLNAFVLLINAYPRALESGMRTDGAQLLSLLRDDGKRVGWRISHLYWPIHFALEEGKYEEAYHAAERALAHYPGDDDFRDAYVTAAARTGRFQAALETAADGKWGEAPPTAVRERLAEVYLTMGLFDLAETELQQAADAAANEEERCHIKGAIALAQLLAGNPGDPRPAYERLPWAPDALYGHVIACLQKRRPADARIALRQAHIRDPFDAEASTRAALDAAVLKAEGHHRQAERRIEQARRGNARPFAIQYAERAPA